MVDYLQGAKHEAGDSLRAQIDWNKVRGLAGASAEARRSDNLAPVLKTVGHAAWNVAAAPVVADSFPLQP